jgi:sarcosine oxidase gamma subunit
MLDERGHWIGPDEWFEELDEAVQAARAEAAPAEKNAPRAGAESPGPAVR